MIKRVLAAVWILVSSAALAQAQERLVWLNAEQMGPSAKVHSEGEQAKAPLVEIFGTGTMVTSVKVLEIEQPQVPSHQYQLSGKIKYENVQGVGYVEMWSAFDDGLPPRFSRTLAETGPMGKISGNSAWRDLVLPFYSEPGNLPTKIWVNVVLPGKGNVFLSPLETGVAGPLDSGWWGERSAGWIGGLGGAFVGILGGTIGVLAGLGKARRLVIGLCIFCIAIGVTAFLVGVVAVLVGQPWHVCYPLLMGGGIAASVCGFNLPGINRRYQQLELRRMTAMDA
ncbi:MAG: hypothetical protein L0Y72_05925 [Gemmataceae bacterium]|nr:hypothetical protein [Gemmataceae bacterium]MCI0738563.1 hypothetical protein [Gemmataceae bacterium]